jgi:RHS repeat-associated protein
MDGIGMGSDDSVWYDLFAFSRPRAISAKLAYPLTNWNGTAISYDLNGNMLSDGANTFSWNARNQVATLNSVSLQYDGFGRRTKNLQNTLFLFDGANAVQELSGSTPTANLISGGIDEILTRADSTGAFTPLQDALGSTIALVDASGNLVTQYAYDPFGNTTVSGATNSNASQYTGRENEGNGLYFYRARYYSPLLGRFVSQDPMGFAGSGPNLYAYAGNSPTNFTDPFGMQTVTSGPVTTPYTGTPTPAQVEEALQSVKNATHAAEAAQAAPSLLESLEGPSVFALATADAQLLVEEIQTVTAINSENAAYDEEWQSVAAYNQAVLAHPRPLPLAGRKDEGLDNGDDRCKKVRQDCQDKCWAKVQNLPVLPQDKPGLLRKCIRQCMADEGCHNF